MTRDYEATHSDRAGGDDACCGTSGGQSTSVAYGLLLRIHSPPRLAGCPGGRALSVSTDRGYGACDTLCDVTTGYLEPGARERLENWAYVDVRASHGPLRVVFAEDTSGAVLDGHVLQDEEPG